MRLCEKIVLLRKKAGLSQEAMAEKLGVSRQAVSRWEVGSALPDASNVLQLSRLFSVTTDYLLNDEYESDGDVPAIRSVCRKARWNVQRMLGMVLAGLGLLGHLTVYIISRCVKVYAPLRTYDAASGRIWYHYDGVLRVDYRCFVTEYRLGAILAVLGLLILAGACLILWTVPSIHSWVETRRELRSAFSEESDPPEQDAP